MKRSTNPNSYPALTCDLCGRKLGARTRHLILTALSGRDQHDDRDRRAFAVELVCATCRERPDIHAVLWPDCTAPDCDFHDHAWNLAADRSATVAALALNCTEPYPTTDTGRNRP